jgi:hypothetical protein
MTSVRITGTYEENAKTLRARVSIHNYTPGVLNVNGSESDYDLQVIGFVEGDMIKAFVLPFQPHSPVAPIEVGALPVTDGLI